MRTSNIAIVCKQLYIRKDGLIINYPYADIFMTYIEYIQVVYNLSQFYNNTELLSIPNSLFPFAVAAVWWSFV